MVNTFVAVRRFERFLASSRDQPSDAQANEVIALIIFRPDQHEIEVIRAPDQSLEPTAI